MPEKRVNLARFPLGSTEDRAHERVEGTKKPPALGQGLFIPAYAGRLPPHRQIAGLAAVHPRRRGAGDRLYS